MFRDQSEPATCSHASDVMAATWRCGMPLELLIGERTVGMRCELGHFEEWRPVIADPVRWYGP